MHETLNPNVRKEVQQKGATSAREGFALDSGDAPAGL